MDSKTSITKYDTSPLKKGKMKRMRWTSWIGYMASAWSVLYGLMHLYWLFGGKEYPFKREEGSTVLRIIEKDDEQRYLKDIYC
jgi:hypothetical protein